MDSLTDLLTKRLLPQPQREPTPEEQQIYETNARKVPEGLVSNAIAALVGGVKGTLGIDPGKDETGVGPFINKATQIGQAALPILGGSKAFQFWHDIPDLERLAGGSGLIRLYHGTPNDTAKKIMEEGIKLPQNGEALAREVAKRYNIPYPQWQRDIGYPSYGSETSRLSTSTFPVASRWAKHFPQGEVASDFNNSARILTEAKRRGIPYDQAYDDIFNEANKLGITKQFDVLDTVGLPDKMRPKAPGGSVLGVDTDVRNIKPHSRLEAEYALKYLLKGERSPLETLKDWNLTYKDFKIDPRKIVNVEVVKKF